MLSLVSASGYPRALRKFPTPSLGNPLCNVLTFLFLIRLRVQKMPGQLGKFPKIRPFRELRA